MHRTSRTLLVPVLAALVALVVSLTAPAATAKSHTRKDPVGDSRSGELGDITKVRVDYRKKALVVSMKVRELTDFNTVLVRTNGSKKVAFSVHVVPWTDMGDPNDVGEVRRGRNGKTVCRPKARVAPRKGTVRVTVPLKCVRSAAGKLPQRVQVRGVTANPSSNMGEPDDTTAWTRRVRRG